MMKRRIFLCLLAPLVLIACKGKKDIDPPAKLVELQPKIRIEKLWSRGISNSDKLRLGLRPTYADGRLFVAGRDGSVMALNPENGDAHWRVDVKVALSGGPGVGAGRVAVGSSEGDIVVLNAQDGAQQWRVRINGEVLAPPALSEKVVVVRAVDGRLHGLDAATGKEMWVNEQQTVPRLSLRGTSAPVIVGEVVICGFDNGKVMAVGLEQGDTMWDVTVAPSHGRTELERLVDIDSAVRVSNDEVFVVGFQGRAAMLKLDSGQTWWAREASSERGLAVDAESLYIANANGDIVALKRKDGSPVWEQKELHRRGLSGPAVDGSAIVVADFQGYVHWLDVTKGEVLARMPTDGERVTNAPLAVDGKVFVLTDGGRLTAFQRVEPKAKG